MQKLILSELGRDRACVSLPNCSSFQSLLSRQAFLIEHQGVQLSADLMEKCRALSSIATRRGLELIIERPVAWFDWRPELNRINIRKMYDQLIACVKLCGLAYSEVDVGFDFHFRAKSLESRKQMLFSYHTRGDAPNIWRIKESVIPPYFTFDRKGYAGWTEMANSQELFDVSASLDDFEALEFVHNLRHHVHVSNVSKYEQPSQSFVSDSPYVFFPMQTEVDSVMLQARLTQTELLTGLVEIAEQLQQPLVVKRHPLCEGGPSLDLLRTLDGHKLVHISNASVLSLIAGAKSVVVTNSGVGMESLIQGKPVYAAGYSEYHWAVNNICDTSELREAFDDPRCPLSEARLAQFLHSYFAASCIDRSRMETIAGHIAIALIEWITNDY